MPVYEIPGKWSQRFLVTTENKEGCHIVTSHKIGNRGYVAIFTNGARIMAHRWVYELHNGLVPDGLVVRHKCDTPACCNPEHLHTGTQYENIQDAVKQGKYKTSIRAGYAPSTAKLTEAQVLEIHSDRTQKNICLAKKYGVCPATITSIKKGQNWSRITKQSTAA